MSRRPARFTEADLSRAMRAAAKQGRGWVVEALPDGTIRLVQGQPAPQKPAAVEPFAGRKKIVL